MQISPNNNDQQKKIYPNKTTTVTTKEKPEYLYLRRIYSFHQNQA